MMSSLLKRWRWLAPIAAVLVVLGVGVPMIANAASGGTPAAPATMYACNSGNSLVAGSVFTSETNYVNYLNANGGKCPSGNEITIGSSSTTPPPAQAAPAVVDSAASSLSATGATLNSTVNPEGAATTYQFQYGTSTSYGTSIPATAASAGSGTSAVAETSSPTGLTASTTYDYRLVATNSGGTTDGANETFTTSASGGGGGTTTTCTETTSSTTSNSTDCGPYNDTEITGTTGDIDVSNNVWSPPSGSSWTQTINATGGSNWNVSADYPAGGTSVLSFPNTGEDQNWLSGQSNVTAPLSSWSAISSSYNVSIPSNSGAVGEAAYDLWLNNWDNEVMIQTDFVGDSLRGRCDVDGDDITTQAFVNESGVSQNWNLCQFGSELIWQPGTGTNFSSDNVNVLAMLDWLENNSPSTATGSGSTTTFLPANSDLTALSFGFEICSTGGTADTWTLNDLSWTATPAASGGAKKTATKADYGDVVKPAKLAADYGDVTRYHTLLRNVA
jgi:hypothetical protein